MSTAAKRIPIVLSILLAAMLAAALAPQPALAEGAQVIDTGHCEGCTWTLDEAGILTIEPTMPGEIGVLPSNDRNNNASFWPWSVYRDDVKSIYVSEGVKAGENVSFMFAGCRNLASADLSNLDVSGALSLEHMFIECNSLKSLDLSRWNVSSVEDMICMFDACAFLESLDLSGWDTSSRHVEDMLDMFRDCQSLAELKLGAKTRLPYLPDYEVNGRRDWYSPDAKRWFSNAEELNGYLGTLDAGAVRTLSKFADIADAEWSGVEGRTYTGEEQTQDPTLTLGGVALERGTHYELSYEGNVAAGTATVTATGIGAGGYTGTASRTFTIAKAKVAVPKAKSGLVYNGKSQTGVPAGAGYTVKGGSATKAGSYTATLSADANHVFSTGKATASVAWSIAKAKAAVPKAKSGLVYNGKSQTGVPAGAGYTVKGGQATKAGSHTATLTADANHMFPTGKTTASVAWSIAKAANTLSAKAKTKKAVAVKAGKALAAKKLFKVSKAKGKVAYKKAKGSKKIAVAKNGKVSVKKGCKKGTYALTVKVKAKGNDNYKASKWKAVKVKVLVK